MAKYIDRDAFIMYLADMQLSIAPPYKGGKDYGKRAAAYTALEEAISACADFHAVEASQIASRWVTDADGVSMCANCEVPALQRMKFNSKRWVWSCPTVRTHYCPSCGAKMVNPE